MIEKEKDNNAIKGNKYCLKLKSTIVVFILRFLHKLIEFHKHWVGAKSQLGIDFRFEDIDFRLNRIGLK